MVLGRMQAQSKIDFSQPSPNSLNVLISGAWHIGSQLPGPATVLSRLEADSRIKSIIIDTNGLAGWDTSFLTFIRTLTRECRTRSITLEITGLPEGVKRLLHLASVVLGETALSLLNLIQGKARFRRIDLLLFIEECGANSLPIVTLISVLVGLILAFVGVVQLKLFGAQVYVANLVAIAMAREMGALMTGIIMAGRVGAAYAAQLGTMQVNEEIDALTTMGIAPMEFLVLPRLLAMLLMMPLLTLYSDLLGILGGAIVGVGMMDITLVQYFTQTQASLDLTNISLGIAKGGIYAIIIAMSGCMRGMQSGRSAAAVGEATTSAVVTAIVGIIVTDGIFAVLCDALGI
jgi:phospholipid/cholesterol/gamma-HCH transport system permease protein